jgi:hypothetical protein
MLTYSLFVLSQSLEKEKATIDSEIKETNKNGDEVGDSGPVERNLDIDGIKHENSSSCDFLYSVTKVADNIYQQFLLTPPSFKLTPSSSLSSFSSAFLSLPSSHFSLPFALGERVKTFLSVITSPFLSPSFIVAVGNYVYNTSTMFEKLFFFFVLSIGVSAYYPYYPRRVLDLKMVGILFLMAGMKEEIESENSGMSFFNNYKRGVFILEQSYREGCVCFGENHCEIVEIKKWLEVMDVDSNNGNSPKKYGWESLATLSIRKKWYDELIIYQKTKKELINYQKTKKE